MPLFDSGDTDVFVSTFREVGLVLWLSLRMCWAHVGSGLSHFGGPNLSVPWQGDVIGVVCRNRFLHQEISHINQHIRSFFLFLRYLCTMSQVMLFYVE